MISGYATPNGTHDFLSNFSSLHQSPNKLSGLTISAAGFGTYRTTISNNGHRQALLHAVQNGINLIDSSSNYGDGGSEELVGSVIEELIEQGQLQRENIVVVTKGGYLQGQNFAISQQRKTELRPFPDLVEYGQGLEHCIHPEFLADQIQRSLARLELETIDIFLLHNPEYFLGWAKKADWDLTEAREEYDRRIALAFNYLEAEVASGRIKRYGISSNSFAHETDSYDFTSLEKVCEIAETISAEHHFQAIQFPMNLLETSGATVINQTSGRTLLDLAHEKGLIALVNRPLNAVVGNNLIRLASLPKVAGTADKDVAEAWIDKLINEEARLQRAVFSIDIPFRTKQEFASTTGSGRLLQQRWEGFGTFSNWRDVRHGYLEPRVGFAVQFLNNRPELPEEASEWITSYQETLMQTLDTISAIYRAKEAGMLTTIKANAETADSDWRGGKTLSQTAIRALRTTQGITSILVGARQISYVDDLLTELNRPVAVKNRAESWQSLAEQVSDK
ncbi:MAG: aryl-alcohol dehydrogenase-like predicted oxidoreductase [Cellvibrionaceae bacterium]|jgi:aryl-alcohol dehydrogenase-like predicted oxidoreductase